MNTTGNLPPLCWQNWIKKIVYMIIMSCTNSIVIKKIWNKKKQQQHRTIIKHWILIHWIVIYQSNNYFINKIEMTIFKLNIHFFVVCIYSICIQKLNIHSIFIEFLSENYWWILLGIIFFSSFICTIYRHSYQLCISKSFLVTTTRLEIITEAYEYVEGIKSFPRLVWAARE